MTGHTYGEFADDLLKALGVTPTRGNRRALGVIFIIEGRNAYWNPLNWTLPSNYPAFNSVGVRIYPNYQTGVAMTADNLLDNSRWAPFVKALNGAKTRFGPLTAIANIYASWGSYPRFLTVTWKQAAAILTETMPQPPT